MHIIHILLRLLSLGVETDLDHLLHDPTNVRQKPPQRVLIHIRDIYLNPLYGRSAPIAHHREEKGTHGGGLPAC